MSTSIGLLMLRIALGALLFGHGTQKLFGWFGGYGTKGTAGWFDSIGYRPGRQLAVLAGLAESTAGVLLALGLVTPLGAAIAIGVMTAAAAVHVPNGVWSANGGFELPGFFAVAAASLGFTGAGRYSIDHALGLHFGWPYGLGAIVLGLVAAAPLIALRVQNQRKPTTTQKPEVTPAMA